MGTAEATVLRSTDVSKNQSETNHENNTSRAFDNGDTDESSFIIGKSLLQFLPSDRSSDKGNSVANGDRSLTENRAGQPKRNHASLSNDQYHYRDDNDFVPIPSCTSLLLHAGNLVATTDPPQQGNWRRRRTFRKRILLRGPPRSGKSTLGMNLAYSEASTDRNLSGGGVSVIVYRPVEKYNIGNHRQRDGHDSSNENDPFPLFCRALPAEIEGTDPVDEETTINNQDENGEWDPDTLSRIRVCCVSSVRELLEDMLVLAGKSEDEQPTRAIVVEDLDQIIESDGDPSNRNHMRSNSDKKNSHFISTMLKIVAIAADTAVAIESKQNESHSPSNRITLLVTLTARDSPGNEKEDSTNSLNQNLRHGTDLSDILAVVSPIDTVVTLSQRRQGIDNATRAPNSHENENCDWKIPRTTNDASSSKEEDAKAKIDASNDANGTEIVAVNSAWQAEIQERSCDQYSRDTRGISLIDYAFVESCSAEKNSVVECERSTELRWKDCSCTVLN